MERNVAFDMLAGKDCECCRLDSQSIEDIFGCVDRRTVFTQREQEILLRIRDAALRVRSLKGQMQALLTAGFESAESYRAAAVELEALRGLRVSLEEERLAAADERMRLLGHV
jgi:hypothetical protein